MIVSVGDRLNSSDSLEGLTVIRALLCMAAFGLSVFPVLAEDVKPTDPGAGWDPSSATDGRWNETEVGPFLASVLPTPSGTIAKGLSIRLGDEKRDAAVVYDTATMSLRAAWTGGFLQFDPARYGIVRSPRIAGKVAFHDGQADWGTAKVRYGGLHQQGRRVALAYTVEGVSILEAPAVAVTASATVFTRTLAIEPHDESLTLQVTTAGSKTPFAVDGPPETFSVAAADGQRVVQIAPAKTRVVLRLAIGVADWEPPVTDPAPLAKPGPRLWGEGLATRGTVAKDDAAYVVDTIGVPFENPWKALLFLTGVDSLADGTLAVSALHGDVWLVDGIDERLDRVRWRRFATGLHQPLGLAVVNDRIHVLGRDQITRLEDRNGDGQADFYACFNNEAPTSTGGHDYAACLEVGPDGSFYSIRAHEGVTRVSRDGTEYESVAKGFRNPVGLGVSPRGMVTASPQEGTWTPASGIFEVKPGGWYGFGGPKKTAERPLGYDPPICWMPRLQDNSSGGQVWTSPKWGPLGGRMLHLSYGQCTALLVMHEQVDGVRQGGTVRLPWFFDSGVIDGTFGPRDDQLYVCGLRGWQTAAAKDGCLQRVRYTGRAFDGPIALKARSNGIAVTFTRPLDRESATDPGNWAVEQWNYRYSKEYGSKDYRVSDPRKLGRDETFVDEVTLSEDGRTAFLVLEDDVVPVMQMGITYAIETADGKPLRRTIFNTINGVGD